MWYDERCEGDREDEETPVLQGNDATFGIAAGWLIVCLMAWASVRRWVGPWSQRHPALAVAGAAAVARAVPALTLDRGLPFDLSAHWWVGALTLAGRDVYADPLAQNRYPYPPLHMYVSALMVWLSGGDAGAYIIADKLIPAAFGVGTAVALVATARRLGLSSGRALLVGALYAVNPLPVLVTSYHGQFEEIPLFFIVLALFLLAGPRQRRWDAAASALLLGVAIAYKTWPLLFLPALVIAARGPVRKLVYVLLALVPLAVSIGWYELAFQPAQLHAALHSLAAGSGTLPQRVRAFVDGDEVLNRLAGYKGSQGFCWGYIGVLRHCWVQRTLLRPNDWVVPLSSKLLLLALLLVGLLLLWRRRVLEALVAAPLAFFLFTPGWGPNYSIWVLPFALLLGEGFARAYTLLVLPAVSLIYLDTLYASYSRNLFSWAVLKPAEAVLCLLAWGGIAVLALYLYLVYGRQPAWERQWKAQRDGRSREAAAKNPPDRDGQEGMVGDRGLEPRTSRM